MYSASYGTYNQQQPMKVFAGQPEFVTVGEVQAIVNGGGRGNDGDHYIKCRRCPESQDQCNAMTDPDAQAHCLDMYKQCRANDCYDMS